MWLGERVRFRDRFVRAGDRHRFTACDPIDYLTTWLRSSRTVTSLLSALYHM